MPKSKLSLPKTVTFPAEFFKTLLAPYGLDYLPLFLSADNQASKRDAGRLYTILSDQMQVAEQQILHIGDYPLADITRAQEKGLMTFLYTMHERDVPMAADSVVDALVQGMLHHTRTEEIIHNKEIDLGFRVSGPAQAAFLLWIKEQAEQNKVTQVLFTSRSAACLNHLVADKNDRIQYSYLDLSQKELHLAAISTDNFATFIPSLLQDAHGLSPSAFLEQIGVQPPATEVMSGLGLGMHVCINEVTYERMTHFLYAYQWKILQVCQLKRRALYQKLKQLNIQDGERVAFVDIGWSGSAQEAFQRAIQSLLNIDLWGYYFCLAPTRECSNRQQNQRMISMIHKENTSPTLIDRLYSYRAVAEYLFAAPQAPFSGFWFDKRELFLDAVTRQNINDEMINVIDNLSWGAEQFVTRFQSLNIRINPVKMVMPLIRFVASPQNSSVLVGDFYKDYSFSVSREEELSIRSLPLS